MGKMAFDTAPFNEDTSLTAMVDGLISRYRVGTAVETGTYHGVTTAWLASRVSNVHTVELDAINFKAASGRLSVLTNVTMHKGSSKDVLPVVLRSVSRPCLFYLDAHWQKYCPLHDELAAIASAGLDDSVILIHDFKVPGTDLGHIKVNGVDLDFEYVRASVDSVYPRGYDVTYNDAKSAVGARRGCLAVTPRNRHAG